MDMIYTLKQLLIVTNQINMQVLILHVLSNQLTFFHMAKMDPIDTRQSMLEEPSNGSKATTYLPPQSVTSIHLSFSSDTITPTYYI